ncbi:hypothetical protein MTY_1079 [Moorella thermoacetica Y72]|uniref:Uncharacterized protein n=1 Tax=Moorella thermoacetica Y72 TaxID=1325331 RepID=A0A0S6UDQ6_NEOTH|nr:hypothetical protein MTY_1079 [Moorella thermoacetica Y72]
MKSTIRGHPLRQLPGGADAISFTPFHKILLEFFDRLKLKSFLFPLKISQLAPYPCLPQPPAARMPKISKITGAFAP